MGSPIAAPRPDDVIRLDEFCGKSAKVWVDGLTFDPSRVEVLFPSEEERLAAVVRLLNEVISDREMAAKLLVEAVLAKLSKGTE